VMAEDTKQQEPFLFSLEDALKNTKFTSLQKYFAEIELDDLGDFSEDELVQLAEPKDRVRMKIFIKQYLTPFLARDNPYKLHDIPTPSAKSSNPSSPRVGDFQGRLISAEFAKAFTDTERISVEDLKKYLSDTNNLQRLDLSRNNLLDSDLPIIARCIPASCAEIDLSYNRFGVSNPEMATKAIIDILGHTNLKFLDITVNPIASVDHREFFMKLENQFERLIFIPKQWIAGKSWFIMVPGDWQELVRRTHTEYYKDH